MNRSLRMLLEFALVVTLSCILVGDGGVARAQAPAPATPPAAPRQILSADQLNDLVAPIALYPDPVLSQVLVASTYPLEIVEAEQWLQQNTTLSGTQLMDAARQQNWDPSVTALVAFPDVLARLNQDIRWTTDLGNAFLAQQSDVMTAVQHLRAQAQANGKLSSSPQQTVTTETQGGQSAIQIEPANPQVVYVPSYDPMYIWGPPAWGYYPPLYYPAFGYGFFPGIDIGFCFGGWGGWGWGGWGGWGWGPNWFGHNVFINNGFFSRYGFRGGFGGGFGGRGFGGRSIWAHDPSHRLGVAYPNHQLAGRFQAASAASRANLSRSYGAGRSVSQFGGASRYGGQSAFRGSQSYRNTAPQGASRGYQYGPRSSSGMSRGFMGGGSRSFGSARGYGGGRTFSGGGRSFGFGGGSARSFGGGHGFGGGGHSFGGGGGHSFGGGGHGFGGGGHSFGGGGHGFGGGGHGGGGHR